MVGDLVRAMFDHFEWWLSFAAVFGECDGEGWFMSAPIFYLCFSFFCTIDSSVLMQDCLLSQSPDQLIFFVCLSLEFLELFSSFWYQLGA